MYIIAHKLYEAQKRPGSLLIQCPMDHQECSEHVVISPKEAVVGAGREVIWRSKPYMGLEVILPHHRDPHRPFKVRSLWFWPFHVALLSGITGVSNHMECTLLFHAFCSDRSSLCFDSLQRCSSIFNDYIFNHPKPVSKTSPWETQMFLGTSEWGKPIQDVWVTNRSRKFQQQIAHELDYGVPFPHCVKRCTFCRHCLFLAFWDFRFRR